MSLNGGLDWTIQTCVFVERLRSPRIGLPYNQELISEMLSKAGPECETAGLGGVYTHGLICNSPLSRVWDFHVVSNILQGNSPSSGAIYVRNSYLIKLLQL